MIFSIKWNQHITFAVLFYLTFIHSSTDKWNIILYKHNIAVQFEAKVEEQKLQIKEYTTILKSKVQNIKEKIGYMWKNSGIQIKGQKRINKHWAENRKGQKHALICSVIRGAWRADLTPSFAYLSKGWASPREGLIACSDWPAGTGSRSLSARGRAGRVMECKQSLTALFSREKGRRGTGKK